VEQLHQRQDEHEDGGDYAEPEGGTAEIGCEVGVGQNVDDPRCSLHADAGSNQKPSPALISLIVLPNDVDGGQVAEIDQDHRLDHQISDRADLRDECVDVEHAVGEQEGQHEEDPENEVFDAEEAFVYDLRNLVFEEHEEEQDEEEHEECEGHPDEDLPG
jgi:hypothetical protein